ncbi:MAG: TrbI/VirB10 family protein [Hyphomonadaceae bacterium JAD_PAG50586_4]|nr:MAG: TrbI/VirB10 family protein [Hyphomonadaceae bacterium JAD_PAG50586_4]
MTAVAQPAPAPDVVAIRARPPSPKRLSRKVLLAGALSMGAIVAVALMLGLSERPDRAGGADPQANAATAGPPETIRLAPPGYDALSMEGAAFDDGGAEADPPEFQPPADASWTGAPTPSAPPAAPRADPEADARASSILFAASGRATTAEGDDTRLDAPLRPPRSPYELMAGSLIPAALVTELNSDLPGRVIAQVTAPVYDSVRGEYLLIPQGARLIGSYDSETDYGDSRLVLIWQRLILPNGWSISLDNMQGTDPTGAAGLRDRTDNHLDRLGLAIGLSAIVSVIANESEGEDDQSLSRSVGNAAAQEAARSGGRIVDRDLSVRPTLRVRAGAPVRVLVTRDIRLRPYRP